MERSTEITIQSSVPPTTFVQTDPKTFRDVVQKLTGVGSAVDRTDMVIPLPAVARPVMVGPRRQTFKLHDRRPSIRNLEIKLGYTSIHSPRSSNITYPNPFFPLSPSSPHYHILSNVSSPPSVSLAPPKASPFPSPVSPLVANDSLSTVVPDATDAAAAATSREWKFYLDPSPRGSGPPQLLALFPLSSPKSNPSGEEFRSVN
ncbi:hypothetical protein ZOSMA_250G00040 [Zostera marina]|uniref:VQ domain-containing protein n=1 Tax=Zostera marina TaxID=29655 RepID=A0A0K9PI92_ZOSMR|nr:hypothetical protein ZOSMA_250G00040 [Zostera marina]